MATSAVISESQAPPRTWPRVLLVLGRIILGAIFIVAAYTKLHFNGGWHFGDYHFFFGMAINSYNLLLVWAVELLARVLPSLEVALSAALIVRVGLRWSGIIASAV